MKPEPVSTLPGVNRETGADTHTRLHGRALLMARVAWLIVVGLTIALFVLSVPIAIGQAEIICNEPVLNDCFNLGQLTPQLLQQLVQLGLSLSFYAAYTAIVQVAFPFVFLAVGALIFWRKSDDWMALLVSLMLVVFGLGSVANTAKLLLLAYPSLTFPTLLMQFLGIALLMLFIFLFPDGRLVPGWIRWLIPFILVRDAINSFLPDSDLVNSAPWFGSQLIEVVIALYSQIYRYRRVSGPLQRHQTKWVVYGLVMAFIGYFGSILLFAFGFTSWTTNVLAVLFLETLLPFFLLLIPLSILIAVLRFRLYEIDILINRTLVYLPLTALLAGIFAATITLSQKLFVALTGEKSDAATVLTTLIVVAVFDPLKNGLQHLVERRFKDSANPSKAWKAYGDELRAFVQIVDMEASLRRLLEEAVRAFGATGGVVETYGDGRSQLVETTGVWNGEAQLSVPLVSPKQNIRVGTLALGARVDGSDYDEKDRASLQATAELVARSLALTERSNGVRQ